MEPSSAATTPTARNDPDLDPSPQRPAGGSRPPLIPQEYQRLVANPFLALLGLIVWYVAVQQALAIKSLPLVGLAVLGMVGVGCLLHYHCLDCGATGMLFRWKSHACPSVLMRQQTGQVRRFRGPNPTFQTVLWGYLLAALGILATVLLLNDLP